MIRFFYFLICWKENTHVLSMVTKRILNSRSIQKQVTIYIISLTSKTLLWHIFLSCRYSQKLFGVTTHLIWDSLLCLLWYICTSCATEVNTSLLLWKTCMFNYVCWTHGLVLSWKIWIRAVRWVACLCPALVTWYCMTKGDWWQNMQFEFSWKFNFYTIQQ